MKILITGATGLIGRALCHALNEEGHTIVGVSRSSRKPSGLDVAEMVQWDPQAGPLTDDALDQVDAVINLAGEPIAAKRWSDQQKKSIRDSRIVITRRLVEGMSRAKHKPQVFVSSSAVGYYGNRGDERLEETSAPGRGFMSEVCQEWEREAARASELGIRVVLVRTGVVLSADGGALEKMLPPFKIGVGGRLGSGKQWFPWIHIDDIVGIFKHAIRNSQIDGPINGAAPQGATNAEFTRELGRALHRPTFLPVPEFALRALMGEMANVLFDSQRVIPAAALASGYEFHYRQLGPALADVLSRT
jgi:uncharacterized protein (TIGR01777 family)